MRLFEVIDNFIDDLTTELRNMKRGSDESNTTRSLSWLEFNTIVSNLGYGSLDDGSLAKLVKRNPALSSLIKTFDDKQITLKTKEEEEQAQAQTDVPDGPSVDQMAHSASKKYMADLS
jgi:hypothetical protein